MEFVDIFPTLVDLAGLPAPEHLDGVSLASLLHNPNAAWNRPGFSQVQFREVAGRSVRTERWRYVEWGEDGEKGIELYDHHSDEQELHNLAGDAKYAEVIDDLKRQLQQVQE